MRVPVIIAFLVFVVLGSSASSIAGPGLHTGCFAPSLHIQKKGPVKCINANRVQPSIANNNSLADEDKTLLCEDVEDDDVNELSPRKYKSVVGFYSILFCQSCLDFRHYYAKAVPFVWRQVSHRYILQRTLRI